MNHPLVKSILQTVVIDSAGLLLAAAIPPGRGALTDPITVAISVATVVLLLTTKLDTLWIILGAAVVSLSASSLEFLGTIIRRVLSTLHVGDQTYGEIPKPSPQSSPHGNGWSGPCSSKTLPHSLTIHCL